MSSAALLWSSHLINSYWYLEINVLAARGEVSLCNLRAPTGQTEGNLQFIFHFKWRWKSSDAAKGLNVAAVKFTFTIVCLALPSEHGGPLFNHNISPRAGFGRPRAWRCRFPWLLTFGACVSDLIFSIFSMKVLFFMRHLSHYRARFNAGRANVQLVCEEVNVNVVFDK